MSNNEYRMSNVEGRYLTILINIKNQSQAIPPFVIHYSLFDIQKRYHFNCLLQEH
jgi:hypothetical protein